MALINLSNTDNFSYKIFGNTGSRTQGRWVRSKNATSVVKIVLSLLCIATFFPISHLFCFVFGITLPQMVQLGFFPNSYATTGNQTHVSRVAHFKSDISHDALSTEQPQLWLFLVLQQFLEGPKRVVVVV